MDYQDKYDELYNIVSTLKVLESEITDEEYIENLRQVRWQAEDELKEVEEILNEKEREEYELEMREREYEYQNMQGF